MEEKKLNSFSIIIPTAERPQLTQRAVNSVLDQTYPNFEVLLIEDGSCQSVKEKINKFVEETNDKRLRIIHHENRMQRLVARNTGIKAAKNEWLCHLDSDDEYSRIYLDCANWAIDTYPSYQSFHFGAMVFGLKGHHTREPFDLKEENEFGEANARFRSGCIGLGSFFYKRQIHEDIGYFPEVGGHNAFADIAKDEFPEMMEWFGPKYSEGGKSLGNNFGDDYYLFYKISRKYKSKMLPFYMYQQFVRRSGFSNQDDDTILNRRRIFK